ncbi:hypothetical protein DMC01_05235 [Campylobacter troglodytis]|nr:hypothetical protein DMC01_05235 [Campylobacter troglodytis]
MRILSQIFRLNFVLLSEVQIFFLALKFSKSKFCKAYSVCSCKRLNEAKNSQFRLCACVSLQTRIWRALPYNVPLLLLAKEGA